MAWNDDWLGEDLTSLDVFGEFTDAVNERRAVTVGTQFTLPTEADAQPALAPSTIPFPITTALPTGDNINWATLQLVTHYLASRFIDQFTYPVIDGLTQTPTEANDEGALTKFSFVFGVDDEDRTETDFPPGGGFTRKFPREIWELANAGTVGQKARLTYYAGPPDGSTFYGLSSGPDFETQPTTPADERELSGTIYEHDGSAWVEAAAGSVPDVVEDQGLIRPGDYAGEWIANELRDALNLLSWSPAEVFGKATRTKTASGATLAAAEANFAAATVGENPDDVDTFARMQSNINATSTSFSLSSVANDWEVQLPSTALVNAIPRDVEFYGYGRTPPSPTYNGVFDGNGEPYVNETWKLVDTKVASTDPLEWGTYGDANQQPDWGTAGTSPTNATGWQLYVAYAVVQWTFPHS